MAQTTSLTFPGRVARWLRGWPLGVRLGFSYSFHNVRQRWKVTLLALGGIALVVAVFVALLSLQSGLRLALAESGRPDNGIIVQRGSQGELMSGFGRRTADRLSVDDRVARNAEGRPLASPELVVAVVLPRKADGLETNVQVRGVTPMAFSVRNVEIVEGRQPTPGLDEVVVGAKVAERFSNAGLGGSLRIKGRDWRVVGVFTAEGSAFESEVWGDVGVMQSAFNRVGGFQSLTVRMADPAQIAAWNRELQTNPELQVDVEPERAYYAKQAGLVGTALLFLALFVSVVMGVGAVFGAMNTMYALVAHRTREIATLRALGFPRVAILVCFVIESLFVALAAGLLGCLLALPVNGLTTATGNVTFSELAFAFRITPASLAAGLVFALVMGFVGGLLPAFRASRMELTAALRN